MYQTKKKEKILFFFVYTFACKKFAQLLQKKCPQWECFDISLNAQQCRELFGGTRERTKFICCLINTLKKKNTKRYPIEVFHSNQKNPKLFSTEKNSTN